MSRIGILAAVILAAGEGCAPMTTPALRHETGDTLGSGKIRVRGDLETSRGFPTVPDTIATSVTQAQEGGVFRGGYLAVDGAVGVLPRWDLSLGTFFTTGGGGWRLGLKYAMLKRGRLAIASSLDYGRFSSKGTPTYTTSTGPVDVSQTLSAYNFDWSFPVSWQFTKTFTIYSGLTYYRSGISGSADMTAISDTLNDLGTNLGIRLTFGRFDTDLEFAFVMLHDPFANSTRIVPFWGIAGAINF